MIKVSVIIPVCNAEKYLQECINSLLRQTISSDKLEIIAVNDGSKDQSLSILQALAGQHKNLVVIDQANAGAAAARNKGLEVARGEYIGFVDADDWVEPNMYEVMYNEAVKHDVDIVFCNIIKNENEKLPAYMKSGVYRREEIEKQIYPRLISSVAPHGTTLRGSVWCKLFRKACNTGSEIRFQKELIYNEDGLFCIEATLAAQTYVYLGDQYLYHNRVNADSITKRYIPNLWDRQKVMIGMLENAVAHQSYSFRDQIWKKTLDIAVYSIENEVKRKNQNGWLQRIRTTRAIMKDPILRECVNHLENRQLKRIDRWYKTAIRFHLPATALMIAKYRYRNNHFF